MHVCPNNIASYAPKKDGYCAPDKTGKCYWALSTMKKSDKIFIAGHKGMVGSAITRALEAAGFSNVLKRSSRGTATSPIRARSPIFFERKNRRSLFSRRPKWVVSRPTTIFRSSF